MEAVGTYRTSWPRIWEILGSARIQAILTDVFRDFPQSLQANT
jgi:hypothetical protein